MPFAKFATNEAIQRTEAYEYAQSLGTQTISLPNIQVWIFALHNAVIYIFSMLIVEIWHFSHNSAQVYKFIYACRLAEHGLSAQAFQYCEVIAKTILKHPSYYSPVLVSQLLEVTIASL